MTPAQKENEILRKVSPKMRIQETQSVDLWQKAAREKLSSLLGLERFKPCNLRFSREYVKEHSEYTEIRFTYQSEEGVFVPCHFLKPHGATSETPVVICLQGHSTGMHVSLGNAKFEGDEESIKGDRDFCIQALKEGMCAVAMEQRGFGELGGTPDPECDDVVFSALLTGRTLIGARVWDVKRLVDVLEQNFCNDCNTEKVYCMGNSGGGTTTLYAVALETRIKAAMPSCAFCTYIASIGELRHCSCNFIPGIANYFDMAEIGGMISPRPLVIVSGKEDRIFPIEPATEEFKRLKELYYANENIKENCIHFIGEGGHRFYRAAWQSFKNVAL